jgi:hypothetical protein
MTVQFKDMQENVPYRWAGSTKLGIDEALALTERHYIKIGEKLIDQLTKKDVANVALRLEAVFIRATEL